MAKSYFAILGISSGATAEEIRSAYRRLAKEFHPDHYPGSSERFQEVQEAYSVLGNRRRKSEYEQRIRKVSPKTPLRRSDYPALTNRRSGDPGHRHGPDHPCPFPQGDRQER